MKLVLLFALAAAGMFAQGEAAQAEAGSAPDMNVNSRYRVESVNLLRRPYRLSGALVEDLERLIGQRLNTEALNRLAGRIREELRAHSVTFKVARGFDPEHVRVLFEVDRRAADFDIHVPTFAYNTKLGWSGEAELGLTARQNRFTIRAVADGESLALRTSGVKARYERLAFGSERVRLAFEFDNLSDRYDRASLAALANASSLGAGADRSRRNFEPSATFVLAKPLTLTIGLSFEQVEPERPPNQVMAARAESINAAINTLRYRRRWEDSDTNTQDIDAGYSLRAAARFLGGDLGYTRHSLNLRYKYSHGRQSAEVALAAGLIYGRAPLFERFVLGNSSTLRGWNKYELDPLGGNRMAHASVTYGYHIMRVFYDTGAVWDRGQSPEARQSAGAGVSTGLGVFHKDAFLLAIAFPFRLGRVEPVFIAGMNF